MSSSKANGSDSPGWGVQELDTLAALGFGPDSPLMAEPKLFLDGAFLAALQAEMEDELGADEARITFFQIGLIHGLRDALRVSDEQEATPGAPILIEPTPLAMRLGALQSGAPGMQLAGSWPDRHEAEARLVKLGKSSQTSCSMSAGYTSGWLSGMLEIDMLALECGCAAAGSESCHFVARETEAWQAEGNEQALELMRRASIASLRAAARVGQRRAPSGLQAFASQLEALPTDSDPLDPAVHVWGPVLVMPFTEMDIALETIEMLGRDPSMRGVRVVVLDLGGALIDEGFGAAGLERLIEEVEAWGAETILTGISPMSEQVVAELQASHLLSRKDLPEAIAYAFQIAEAQRHLL
jgi:anti-anti-sigma regulatory factor